MKAEKKQLTPKKYKVLALEIIAYYGNKHIYITKFQGKKFMSSVLK